MFLTLKRPRTADWPHHRSPYLRIILVVLVVHLFLFVFTPPFHFKPYELEADELMVVQEVPDIEIPKRPDDIAPPNPMPTPYPAPDGPDVEFPKIDDFFKPVPPAPKPSPNAGYVPFDMEPVAVKFVTPTYPDLARQAGLEGMVTVKVTININGKVINAIVVWSDVTESMEREALKAAMMCEFEPAMQQNEPVRVDVVIPFLFRLQSCP